MQKELSSDLGPRPDCTRTQTSPRPCLASCSQSPQSGANGVIVNHFRGNSWLRCLLGHCEHFTSNPEPWCQSWVQIQPLPLTSFVVLGNSLYSYEPVSSYLK